MKDSPIVVHIIYKLAIGGIETVLVDFINSCSEDKYRHIIICLTNSTDFEKRLTKKIPIYELHKKEGKDPKTFFHLLKLLREIRPAIVHTYNIGTLEYQLAALLVGTKIRIHAEHGRDSSDIHGDNKKYIFLRKVFRRIVSRWVVVSGDLHDWLLDTISVSKQKVILIYNGVDIQKYVPGIVAQPIIPVLHTEKEHTVTIGTVGRLDTVKNQKLLIRSFGQLLKKTEYKERNIRLVIAGDGPLQFTLKTLVTEKQLESHVWFAGARSDIPDLLNELDVFVLSSIAEGTPMTVLEAMAAGIPVVATDVGGLAEIVQEGKSGMLVPSGDTLALSNALDVYVKDEQLRKDHGKYGRELVEKEYSIEGMSKQYIDLYYVLLQGNV